MALKVTLGRYYAADSPIHHLDPRAKLLCAFAIMITVFFIQAPVQLVLGWAFMLVLLVLSRIPLSKVLQSIRPVILVLLMLSVFNLFLVREGATLAELGWLVITTGGAWAAILYSLRLVIAVIAATLVLQTTTPTQLTDAFDRMLSPLARIGLPAHELAMVFSLMLRFIPTLVDETQAILDAQTSRGGAIGQGSIVQRMRAIVPIIVSLLASSLRHADNLSRALDARCYEGGAARTHWHPLVLGIRDAVAAVVTLVYVVVLLLLG